MQFHTASSPIPPHNVTIYIDNQEAVNRTNNPESLCHNSKYYPLSKEIHYLTSKLHAKISWKWIKGHSTDESLPHQLNQIADHHAQSRRKSLSSPPPKWPYLHSNTGILYYNNLPVINTSSLLNIDTTEELLVYYTQKWDIPIESLSINKESLF